MGELQMISNVHNHMIPTNEHIIPSSIPVDLLVRVQSHMHRAITVLWGIALTW